MTESYPKIKQAILLCVMLVGVQLFLSLLTGIVSVMVKHSVAGNHYVAGLVNLLAFGIVLIYGKNKTKLPFKDVLPFKRVPFYSIIAILFLASGLCVILSEIDNIVRLFFPMPEFIARIMLGLTINTTNVISSILVLSVIAPITEEFFFRGLILQGFVKRYSVKKAVIASSILFAVVHINPWQFIGALTFGVVLALIFVRYNSLILCLIGHSVMNFYSVLGKITGLKISGLNNGFYENSFQPVWLDVTGLLLVMAGLAVFVIGYRRSGDNFLSLSECATSKYRTKEIS